MKKIWRAISIAALGVCTTLGFASCDTFLNQGGDNSSSSGNTNSSSQDSSVVIKNAPVIRNKPTDNTLTITGEGNTYQFEVSDYDGDITWISTVNSVATISENGLLTMLGAGYTEVIAKDEVTGLSDSVVLTIVDGRISEVLTITGMPQTVRVGDEAVQLSVTSSQEDNVSVIYTSSNPGVATISETGLLTPVAKGITTITVTKTGTSIQASLQVEVLGAEIESVEVVNLPKFGMLVGNSYPLSATCYPLDCENYEIEWSVDNASVAVLDGLNNLVAISTGECTITATVKGTEITASKTVEVSELSNMREDFRFATVGTSNVMNVGPTITFNNVDGEIVEYGADQALKVTTRANNAYNNVTVNFGEIPAGNYKFSMMFKVLSGRHSGAMVKDSDSKEFGYIMATTALGNDEYCFYFNQETAGTKKFAFSAQQWKMMGEVLIDNIVLEKVDAIPDVEQAGKIEDATFDNFAYANGQPSNVNGVYVNPRKFATELVDDSNGGKALKITRVEGEYGYIALCFGDITAGNYTLTLDIENYDYQAILQVAQISNVNGLWNVSVLQDIKYGELDTIFEQAEQNGNIYTLSFSVAQDVENFALALSTNTKENAGESIIIDNVRLQQASKNIQVDFENATLPVVNKVTGAGNVDFGKGLIVTSQEIVERSEQGYVTEDGNTYYMVKFLGWNTYSLINFGTLAPGKYTIKMDVKLLSGTMKGRFVTNINGVQTELTESAYTKDGDTYTFVINVEETANEFCVGYRSVKETGANFTIAYDNISIAECVAPERVEISTYPQSAIKKYSTFDFAATVLPANSEDCKLVWSVDNGEIGEIDANGKFTAKQAGTCNVTVTIEGTQITASVAVTVEIIQAEAVAITTAPQGKILKGSTFDFEATVLPENSEGYTLVWSVDNETVGEIDANGKFTALAQGTCNVTVTIEGTQMSASVAVEVDVIEPESVEITAVPTGKLYVGDTFDFVATISPADCAEYTLVWSVDSDEVGAIDENGKFTAIGKGSCTVTVTVQGTDITASVTVSVDRKVLPPDEGGESEGTAPDGYDGWTDKVTNP